jgi:hypothetical protein
MTLSTLFKYLIGNRQAILDVAASRSAVFVGLLFVLAAGLAREYDGEDLRSEPWHLLLPLGASLVTSALLYMLLKALLWIRGGEADGHKLGYQELLSLYWMTAPLALLYGIPVERFLSAGDATRANLALLAIVSLWRVVLMTRAISILYGLNFFRALVPIMLFADTGALTLIRITPKPIVGIMGGIRLSESESVLHEVTCIVLFLGILSWPIWLIGTIVAVGPTWQLADFRELPQQSTSRGLWFAAAASIVAWFLVLPFTQPEQRLRHQVETDLRADRIREGLELMSAHERSDFPPHWDPPPRLGYRESTPDIMDVMAYIDVVSAKDWVRSAYAKKFSNSLRGESEPGVWWELKPQEIERRIAIIEQLPEKDQLIEEHGYALEMAMDQASSPLKERIEKLLKESGHEFIRDQRR